MSFIQASASICVFTVGDMNVDVSNSSSSKVLLPDNSYTHSSEAWHTTSLYLHSWGHDSVESMSISYISFYWACAVISKFRQCCPSSLLHGKVDWLGKVELHPGACNDVSCINPNMGLSFVLYMKILWSPYFVRLKCAEPGWNESFMLRPEGL